MGATVAIMLAQQGQDDIAFTFDLAGIIALVAGILILIVPRILNYVVAAYLIIIGLITLFDVNLTV